jgi:hypothetical protein
MPDLAEAMEQRATVRDELDRNVESYAVQTGSNQETVVCVVFGRKDAPGVGHDVEV